MKPPPHPPTPLLLANSRGMGAMELFPEGSIYCCIGCDLFERNEESCKSKYFDQALPNWLYPSSVGLSESVFLKVELELDPLGNRCVYVVSFHFVGCAARVGSTVMGLGTTVVVVFHGMNCVCE
ncbi:hypothetical protein T09_3443 [Trichinella sp. T9]|nr:hypothetical protein T09_3443 [Trichinella sp. T9]